MSSTPLTNDPHTILTISKIQLNKGRGCTFELQKLFQIDHRRERRFQHLQDRGRDAVQKAEESEWLRTRKR